MTKKEKELIKAIDLIIKTVEKDFGKFCSEIDINCGSCQMTVMIAYLRHYKDLIEWE